MRERAALWAAIAALACATCQHPPVGGRTLADCPGALRPVGEIPEDFRLEQRLRIRAPRASASLRIAVEKRGTRLVLIGLNELGAKLFTVVQTDGEVQVEALPAAVLPVAPLGVLRDLHRVRFLGAGAAPDASGRAEGLYDGTRITETWRAGALVRRSFQREADPGGERVIVEFNRPDAASPARVRIENGWCGYTALIDTLDEEPLP
ncbi:MAG TPA: DUF3261 domain-containing protein [Myxococcota bacterium]